MHAVIDLTLPEYALIIHWKLTLFIAYHEIK